MPIMPTRCCFWVQIGKHSFQDFPRTQSTASMHWHSKLFGFQPVYYLPHYISSVRVLFKGMTCNLSSFFPRNRVKLVAVLSLFAVYQDPKKIKFRVKYHIGNISAKVFGYTDNLSLLTLYQWCHEVNTRYLRGILGSLQPNFWQVCTAFLLIRVSSPIPEKVLRRTICVMCSLPLALLQRFQTLSETRDWTYVMKEFCHLNI